MVLRRCTTLSTISLLFFLQNKSSSLFTLRPSAYPWTRIHSQKYMLCRASFSIIYYLCTMNVSKKALLGLTLVESCAQKDWVCRLSPPCVAKWICRRHVASIDDMTNISSKPHEVGNAIWNGSATCLLIRNILRRNIKYLFPTRDIVHETVPVFPEIKPGRPLCFMSSGLQNLSFYNREIWRIWGNTVADILNQIYALPRVNQLLSCSWVRRDDG